MPNDTVETMSAPSESDEPTWTIVEMDDASENNDYPPLSKETESACDKFVGTMTDNPFRSTDRPVKVIIEKLDQGFYCETRYWVGGKTAASKWRPDDVNREGHMCYLESGQSRLVHHFFTNTFGALHNTMTFEFRGPATVEVEGRSVHK